MKNYLRITIVLMGLLGSATAANAACQLGTFTEQNTYSLPGCPEDVKDIILRVYMCDHWTGEEGYDKARAAEINAAVKRLRCNSLVKDYLAIRDKYKSDAVTSDVLTKAFPSQDQ